MPPFVSSSNLKDDLMITFAQASSSRIIMWSSFVSQEHVKSDNSMELQRAAEVKKIGYENGLRINDRALTKSHDNIQDLLVDP